MLKCILAGRGSRDEGANRSEGGLYKLLTGAARCRRLARAPRRGCAVPGRGGSPAPSPRRSGPRRAKQLWRSGHRRGGAFFPPSSRLLGGAGGSLATASLQAGQGPPAATWADPGGPRSSPAPLPPSPLMNSPFPAAAIGAQTGANCKNRVAAAGCSSCRAAGCAAGSRGWLGERLRVFSWPPAALPAPGLGRARGSEPGARAVPPVARSPRGALVPAAAARAPAGSGSLPGSLPWLRTRFWRVFGLKRGLRSGTLLRPGGAAAPCPWCPVPGGTRCSPRGCPRAPRRWGLAIRSPLGVSFFF